MNTSCNKANMMHVGQLKLVYKLDAQTASKNNLYYVRTERVGSEDLHVYDMMANATTRTCNRNKCNRNRCNVTRASSSCGDSSDESSDESSDDDSSYDSYSSSDDSSDDSGDDSSDDSSDDSDEDVPCSKIRC